MQVQINIRGADHRGSFTIQTRVEAPSLLVALTKVLVEWAISSEDLVRIHLQPAQGKDDSDAA